MPVIVRTLETALTLMPYQQHEALTAYAQDVVGADARLGERIADLGSERDTYREIALALLEAPRDLTVKHQTLTNENHQLRDQNRALYEELQVRCDGDVWAEAEELEGAPA